jgi:hypothetical protein
MPPFFQFLPRLIRYGPRLARCVVYENQDGLCCRDTIITNEQGLAKSHGTVAYARNRRTDPNFARPKDFRAKIQHKVGKHKRSSLGRQSPLVRIVKKRDAPRFKKRDENGVIDVSLAVRVVVAHGLFCPMRIIGTLGDVLAVGFRWQGGFSFESKRGTACRNCQNVHHAAILG